MQINKKSETGEMKSVDLTEMNPVEYYNIVDGLWMLKDYYVGLLSRSTSSDEKLWVHEKIGEVVEILSLFSKQAWRDK